MTAVGLVPIFFSRLVLDPRSRQVRSELAHPYEMHRTLMCAFPECPATEGTNAREKLGILFRADADEQCHHVTVYLQSLVEPDWSFLSTYPGYLLPSTDSSNPVCKDVSGTYHHLQGDQVLSFRLRANPTRRVWRTAEGDENMKGKRVGLLREQEQIAWLSGKGKDGGFELITRDIHGDGHETQVPQLSIRVEGSQRGRKHADGRPQEMTHLAVCFDGLLRIRDVNVFRQTLVRGIGSAKAFGFGLLSISPVRRQGT